MSSSCNRTSLPPCVGVNSQDCDSRFDSYITCNLPELIGNGEELERIRFKMKHIVGDNPGAWEEIIKYERDNLASKNEAASYNDTFAHKDLDKFVRPTGMSDKIQYIDTDTHNYKRYLAMKTGSAVFGLWLKSIALYLVVLMFFGFILLQIYALSQSDSSLSPPWALLYIPIGLWMLYKVLQLDNLTKLAWAVMPPDKNKI